MKNIYQEILNRADDKTPLALATITAVKGSSPQKQGSSALFGPDGRFAGTVGGGYVERTTEKLAYKTIKSGESGLFHLDLDNETGIKDIEGCDRCISILIEYSPQQHQQVFLEMKKSIEDRKAGVLVTGIIKVGTENIRIERYWKEAPSYHGPKSSEIREAFTQQVSPLPRLVIIGAGHIGKELCHLGSRLDFDITVIDDRKDYANFEMLPEADEILMGDIGKLANDLSKTPDTYIIIVSRSHAEDASALKACINSNAGYIGMIGSKKKISQMKDKFLSERICTPEKWNMIHTPVGIDIGAKTVGEIGISIAAELIRIRAAIDRQDKLHN